MLPTISCIRKVALCILLLVTLFTLTLSDSLAQSDEANRTTAQQGLQQQQHHHHQNHGHHAHGHHHGSNHHQQNEQQKHQTNEEDQQQISSSNTDSEINNNDNNQKLQQQQSAEMEEESTPSSSAAAVPSRAKQLFREYLSRGMLTCTTKYVAMLQKLNKLIATAHDEYTKCQRMADKADSRGEHTGEEASRLKAQMEMIDQLLRDD